MATISSPHCLPNATPCRLRNAATCTPPPICHHPPSALKLMPVDHLSHRLSHPLRLLIYHGRSHPCLCLPIADHVQHPTPAVSSKLSTATQPPEPTIEHCPPLLQAAISTAPSFLLANIHLATIARPTAPATRSYRWPPPSLLSSKSPAAALPPVPAIIPPPSSMPPPLRRLPLETAPPVLPSIHRGRSLLPSHLPSHRSLTTMPSQSPPSPATDHHGHYPEPPWLPDAIMIHTRFAAIHRFSSNANQDPMVANYLDLGWRDSCMIST